MKYYIAKTVNGVWPPMWSRLIAGQIVSGLDPAIQSFRQWPADSMPVSSRSADGGQRAPTEAGIAYKTTVSSRVFDQTWVRVFSEHIPAIGPLGDFLSARGVETDGDVAPAKARPKLSDG